MAVLLFSGCYGNSEQTLTALAEPPGSRREVPPQPEEAFVPAPLSIRRLLGWQYRNAIRDLLGAEAAQVVTPPPDAAVNGFDAIGAAQLTVSANGVDDYRKSALAAAQQGLADATRRAALVPCAPSAPDDAACLEQVVRAFGVRAWRRPLLDDEVQDWVQLGQEAGRAHGAFDRAMELVMAGLLQSPDFLYQIEVGEPDPDAPERLRLTDFELATRMSFFLVGSIPDAALLEAAAQGELSTPEGIRQHAQRLLEKPEARAALQRFFDEAFQLRALDDLVKDTALFPQFSPALARAMRTETELLIEDVIWTREGDLRDVLDAPWTFVNADLAALYDLPAASQSGFARVDLPATSKRAGFLSQASFLAMNAHTTETSPTHRGKFIRERLLCGTIPAPPPGVSTMLEPVPDGNPRTMRERLKEHQTNPSCSGCHVMMDNLGLGFENFDALGRYRETEHGLPIDPVSQFDDKGSFDGPRALAALLRDDARVTDCIVRNVFRMATGHVDTAGEAAAIRRAQGAFAASGYRMKALLAEVVASDAFRFAAKQEVQP